MTIPYFIFTTHKTLPYGADSKLTSCFSFIRYGNTLTIINEIEGYATVSILCALRYKELTLLRYKELTLLEEIELKRATPHDESHFIIECQGEESGIRYLEENIDSHQGNFRVAGITQAIIEVTPYEDMAVSKVLEDVGFVIYSFYSGGEINYSKKVR